MSSNLRVYKQSELASRDTEPPLISLTVPDPDLEIGGGGGHPETYKTGRRSPKNRASVFIQIREAGAPRAPSLDPPLINTYGL